MDSSDPARRFWAWCGDQGVQSRPLHIKVRQGSTPALRGLFATDPIKRGAVVASVPRSACLSYATIAQAAAPVVPSPAIVRRAFRGTAHGRFECQFLWLAAALAALRPVPASPWAPYLTFLPLRFPPVSQADVDRLEPSDAECFQEICVAGDGAVRRLSALLAHVARKRKLTGDVPTAVAVEWGYRAVMSRAVLLPSGSREVSAPDPLPDFLDRRRDLSVVPTLVPVVDLVNCPTPSSDAPRSNVVVMTALDRTAAPEEASRVALIATRDIDRDEELLVDYETADDAVTLFRYGFLPR